MLGNSFGRVLKSGAEVRMQAGSCKMWESKQDEEKVEGWWKNGGGAMKREKEELGVGGEGKGEGEHVRRGGYGGTEVQVEGDGNQDRREEREERRGRKEFETRGGPGAKEESEPCSSQRKSNCKSDVVRERAHEHQERANEGEAKAELMELEGNMKEVFKDEDNAIGKG